MAAARAIERMENGATSLGLNNIGAEGGKALGEALKQNKTLLELKLRWNNIGAEGGKALGEALKQNKTLLELDLWRNYIGAEGCKALGEALKQNKTLQTLYLGSNNIGDEGGKALGEALKQNKTLQWLDLHDNNIGDKGGKALGEALKQNKTLQWLDLGYNNIGAEGVKALGEALKQNKTLRTLYLGGNRIGDEGGKALGEALKQNKTLQTLDLSDNKIDAEGGKALGEALKQNKTLQSLNLGPNNIGAEGGKALGEALKQNKTLQALLLFGNNIGDEGGKALGEALKQNKTLLELRLPRNNIGPNGAKALAGALKENSCMLESLNIWGNRIRNKGAEALASALETNDILRKLSLDEEAISSDILARIRVRVAHVESEVRDINATAHEALKTNEKVRWGRAKLMVVGKAAAGKTSTIRTLLNQPFNPSHDSTIGVQLTLMRTRDWKERMHLGDADLGEQFAKYKYRRQSVVKRVSRRMSELGFRVSESRVSQPRKSRSRKSETRKSAEHRASMRFNEENIAKANRTSLRVRVKKQAGTRDEEVSFTIWDYGGQEVFYALHHLFLTQYGVYVLVFDMREVLGKDHFAEVLNEEEFENLASQEDALNTLRFWIDSIRLHAPSVNVALVGTYLDQVPDPNDHDVIHETLKGTVLKGLGGKPAVVRNSKARLHFFPIDNTARVDVSATPTPAGASKDSVKSKILRKLGFWAATDQNEGAVGGESSMDNTDGDNVSARVADLRTALSKAVADKAFIKDKVPLRWSYCLDQLLSRDEDHLPLNLVETIAEDDCHIPRDDVHKMLKYMHELGVLVHLTTGQNDVLRQIVVIRPQWLLDTLSRVICDPDVGHMRKHKKKLLYHTSSDDDDVNDGNEEELPVELEDALEEWANRGVASRDLLEWLWQREPIDYLRALMNSMLLACPSPWIGNGDEEGALLIPSLLRGVDYATREEALRGLGDQRALAYIEFAVLPQGVFQRLIASVVQSLPVSIAVGRHGVFSDFASMDFDGVGVILETSGNRVMLYFERPANRSLTNHVSILKRSLESINSSFMKGNLEPELFVSSDGTDRETACASVRAIDQAIDQAASDVTSRGLRTLPLTAFALFIASSEAAKFLLSSDRPFDVFLSHAWGKDHETHRKVKAVADALEDRGIKCWIDGSNIGSDVLKSMADGIAQSKAVVVFVTQTYMDNVNKDRTIPDNCRTEFYHALHTHGPANMIPCVLEPGLDSTRSWTGVFRAGWSGEPLFVRMLNGAESSSEVDDLVWAIQKVLDAQEDAARCS